MLRLPLQDLSPGQTLGTPVYSVKGVLLLRAGEVLTAKHLAIFKSWGIDDVDVLTDEECLRASDKDSVPGEISAPPDIAAAIERRVAHRFRFTDPADPVIAALRSVVTARLTRRVLFEAARRKATSGRSPAQA